MTYNKDEELIKKILSYCEEISEIKSAYIDSIEVLETQPVYRHACCMCILQIGELSSRLSDDFKEKYNGVPWVAIKGMRNIFAHEYAKVDIEDTWTTIKNKIPELQGYCTSILEDF